MMNPIHELIMAIRQEIRALGQEVVVAVRQELRQLQQTGVVIPPPTVADVVPDVTSPVSDQVQAGDPNVPPPVDPSTVTAAPVDPNAPVTTPPVS